MMLMVFGAGVVYARARVGVRGRVQELRNEEEKALEGPRAALYSLTEKTNCDGVT